jgi:ABC-type branched-subunit amino acid transport system substrate-binding protein
MITNRSKLAALVAAGVMLVAACSSDNKVATTTPGPATTAATAATEAPSDTSASVDTASADTASADTAAPDTAAPDTTTAATDAKAAAWAVNTDDCVDPGAANAPITGTVKIGSVMPLTGGVAAAAFAPVKDGLQAYIDFANEKGLLGDTKIELSVEDDQYSKDLTPVAVSKLIDSGVNLFTGIIGSANNAAVRQTLNDDCIPQLNALSGSPEWGRVADFPWTTGLLVPYNIESRVYAKQISNMFPAGATVAMFYVNSEFGQVYADAFKELATEFNLTIVDEQTIEATDSNPPTSQITSIAGKKPDVIMAVPLGAGCIGFLTELASSKAQNAGWDPKTFVTNTCASSLILGAAADAANGLYTSGNLVDIGDPANQSIPAVKEYIDFMTGIGKADIVTTAGAGWTTGEITVAILAQAQASPEGLTRASIINAARNFTHTGSLARPGVVARSMGEEDPYLSESLQVLQYDATAKTFSDIGTLITDYETK